MNFVNKPQAILGKITTRFIDIYSGFLFALLAVGFIGCSSSTDKKVADPTPRGATEQTQMGPYISKGLDRPALKNQEVLEAMSRVPRHLFVPEEVSLHAYEDKALPIGSGQTISQPYIVALMTQDAQVTAGSKVLEIGTGSGYQAAVLAELGAEVFTIEIVEELARTAEELLKEIGYTSIHVRHGDGWQGWEEQAPFDVILVTASAPHPSARLLSQLADEGRLIIPIEGDNGNGETLMLFERDGEDYRTRKLGSVKFVPLTGEAREEQN